MKLIGLKNAVGKYQLIEHEGARDNCWYAKIMLDVSTGELWTDLFHSLGHNEWKEYHDSDIICISEECAYRECPINMKNVKEVAIEFMETRKTE